MLAELKSCFMEAYDDNQDGKIDIREVIQGIYFLLNDSICFNEFNYLFIICIYF